MYQTINFQVVYLYIRNIGYPKSIGLKNNFRNFLGKKKKAKSFLDMLLYFP